MKLHKSPPGVALVIVLGFLVLISVLTVAFFSSVSTELKASRNFAAGVTTRQLADSAVQMVMGQIHDATSRPSACWASQPGMIRVYRDGTGLPSINADAFFKLYSSNNMVVTKNQLGSFDPLNFSQDLPGSWSTSPAFFTDLNAPVKVTDPTNPTGSKILRYPIMDPGAIGMVDGFGFGTNSVGASATNPVMPVAWIYVLQDGTLLTPDAGGTGTTASFTGTIAPTLANPIVGRIAFWADDECSKLNLNTAAGYIDNPNLYPAPYNQSLYQNNYAGSFWDTPRFYSTFDMGIPSTTSPYGMPSSGGGGLAICQLLQNEFQRYPGHPGTTSLSPVLRNFLTSDQLYTMLPRYSTLNMNSVAGSSAGGTVRVVVGTSIPNPTPDTLQLQPKPDRLYASVDDLLFAAKSTTDWNYNTYTRRTNNTYLGVTTITADMLDKVRFFLTTQSRAPELNLYGQPRVSIWPVRYQTNLEGNVSSSNGLNAFDNTILFCSSVGQTTNTTPPNTESLPPTLPYRYIFTRREMPALKNTNVFASAPPQDINYTRNAQLLAYLQVMTGKSGQMIPGFSGNGVTNLWSKYGADNMNSILTEIFDYIRCANSIDTTTMDSSGTRNPAPFAPQGIIMPSRVTLAGSTVPNLGMGRFPTVSEASLVFYYAGPRPVDPKTPFGKIVTSNSDGSGYPTYRRYRAFLLFSTFDPMQGYAPTSDPHPILSTDTTYSPIIQFTIPAPNTSGGLDQLTMSTYADSSGTAGDITNQKIFPISATLGKPYTATDGKWINKLYRASGGAWGGRNYGGYEGFMHTLIGGQYPNWFPNKIALGTGGSATNPANPLPYPQNAVAAQSGPLPTTNGPGYTVQEFYEFQSPDPNIYPAAELAVKEKIGGTPATDTSDQYFSISGATITVGISYGGMQVQTLTLTFPPTMDKTNAPYTPQYWPLPKGDPGTSFTAKTTTNNDPSTWVKIAGMEKYYWTDTGSFYPAYIRNGVTPGNPPTTYQTSVASAWSLASRICWSMQNSYAPLQNSSLTNLNNYGTRWQNIVQPGDTIRSLIYCQTPGWASKSATVGTTNTGDMRLAALQATSSNYYPHPEYYTTFSRACLLRMADGNPYFPPGSTGFSISGKTGNNDTGWGNHIPLTGSAPGPGGPARFPYQAAFGNFPYSAANSVGGKTAGVNGVTLKNGNPGDFDTGIGSNPDGPFANKQDEGNVIYAYQDPLTLIWYYPVPYFAGTWQYQAPGNTYTSPCRQMPSPAMFGSLPSRVATNEGWTTLCFCPNPAAGPGGTNHPGNLDPKDHLLLDLFQMPVVEPYPISEPFSTAGKVNLNYKIAPFGYITRTTALRGALTPLRVSAVSGASTGSWSDDYLVYKSGQRNASGGTIYQDTTIPMQYQTALPVTTNYRQHLDMDATIAGFESYLDQGTSGSSTTGFFRSASQICEMYLYPVLGGLTIAQFWSQHTLTGDNVREKPYVDLYNRLTTKSNTYTVHLRVQTLRQLPRGATGSYGNWNEGKDVILGEYRGSSTIERYIDPADRRFNPSDPVTSQKQDSVNPDTQSLDGFYNTYTQSVESLYRFRTVITKKFSP